MAVSILPTIIGTAIFGFIAVAVGYAAYLKFRPKKETWKARIYWHIPGEAPRPYKTDTIEKVEKAPGITVYRLQGMKKPLPAITGSVSENWGKFKLVNVLTDGNTCTLLEKKYKVEKPILKNDEDKASYAEFKFNPIPFDRQNLMKSEVAMHTSRLKDDKNVLQTITTFVTVAVLIFGLVAIAYFMGNTFVSVSNNIKETQILQNEGNMEVAKLLRTGYVATADNEGTGGTGTDGDLGKQTTTTTLKKPPVLE